MQAVGGGESLVAVRAFREFVTESGAPLWSVGGGLRDGFQSQTAGVVAADFDGEGIVEAEGWSQGEVESLRIFGLDLLVDPLAVGAGFFFEDGGECRAGVFGIDVDAACENS